MVIQTLTLKYIALVEINVHNSIATEENFKKYGENNPLQLTSYGT